MKRYVQVSRVLALVALSLCGNARAQNAYSQKWENLIDAGRYKEATAVCTAWIKSPDRLKQAEGHKCLANVDLSGKDNQIVVLEGNDLGGGDIGGGYKPEAINAALAELNQALLLEPQDLSIHEGRLHLLEVSMRIDDMAKALDESCTIYHGADGLQAWLAYPDELFEDKEFRASIALLNVLNKHYPNNHDVLGNLGAAYAMLNEDDKAIEYLQKAVRLAPDDPIDTWNLGRLCDFDNKIQLADMWYRKSLSLDRDSSRRRSYACMYAEFIDQKLHNPKRACQMEKANCEPEKQTACAEVH